jgi:rare lipoprotein A
VKVDYVGRAPLAGSDDVKLAATLREGVPASAPVMVATNKPFAPAYFDARPMTQVAGKAPTPPDRPYRLGEGAREVPGTIEAQAPSRESTTELAAAGRPHPVESVVRKPLEPAEPAVSPVSAYAPAHYDAPAGFMSGRGLY